MCFALLLLAKNYKISLYWVKFSFFFCLYSGHQYLRFLYVEASNLKKKKSTNLQNFNFLL